MADSTENGINRVTSGRRALVAAWVRQATNLPALYAAAWADACAALVEDGWPTASRSLLARQLSPADVDRAGRTLLGGIPPEPDELTRRRLAHALPELAAPSDGLPRWATVGVQLGNELIFARPTLDLDAAEAADARQWPPVTVAAYQTSGGPPVVLVEVGASLRRPDSSQARRAGCRPRSWTPPMSSTRPGRATDERRRPGLRGRAGPACSPASPLPAMTQDQLADRARLSRSFISLFETGDRGIEVRALRRIAHDLDLSLPALVAEPGEARFPWPPAVGALQ